MKEPKKTMPIFAYVVFAFLLMGILSTANYIINLTYHDVMALGNLCQLGLPTVFLLVGTILFASALKDKGKWTYHIGAILIMVGSVSLVLISLNIPQPHKQQETPETPPSTNTAEPSQPAPNLAPSNEPKTGQPKPSLQTAMVSGLCEILLDEDEDMHSRESAAQALGQIRSPQAIDALKKVLAGNSNRRLKNAAQNALSAGMGQPRAPDDSEDYEHKPRTRPKDDSPSEEP